MYKGFSRRAKNNVAMTKCRRNVGKKTTTTVTPDKPVILRGKLTITKWSAGKDDSVRAHTHCNNFRYRFIHRSIFMPCLKAIWAILEEQKRQQRTTKTF